MKTTLLFFTLSILPATSLALTPQEMQCGAVSVYHEARGLKPDDWDKVFKVAINRKKHPKRFGAKSASLCDIVHSRQYETRNLRNTRELAKYKEILNYLNKGNWKLAGNYLYFSFKRGKMRYRTKFKS